MILKEIRTFCLFFLALGLFACGTERTSAPELNTMQKGIIAGTATGLVIGGVAGGVPLPATGIAGGILGGALGKQLDKHESAIESLEKNDVQLVRQGEKVRLILPADDFFYLRSPRLNDEYRPVLDDIAHFLRKLDKISIEVAAYTDDQGTWRKKMALTRTRAQIIADELWDKGVDARVMVATGYGDAQPIAGNETEEGRAKNRRVEIRLQELPA